MIVVPALLEQRVDVQKSQLLGLSPFFTRFQIDIADSTLVPNTTTQIKELLDSSFFNIVSHAIFDFHLMVSDPEKHIRELLALPKKRLGIALIHQSVFPDASVLKNTFPDLKFGLVLNPEEGVDAVEEATLSSVKAVQIMTIVPGFQGSSFIEKTLIKVEQLRKRGFIGEVMIDGSVNEATLPLIFAREKRPDVLAVGSYFTKAHPSKLSKRVHLLQSKVDSMEQNEEKSRG